MRKGMIGLLALVLLVSFGAVAAVADAEETFRGKYRWVEVDEEGNHVEETIEIDGPRPYLGVQMGRHAEPGAAIRQVMDESAAAAAGLEAGDRVVAFNGEPINNPSQLTRAVLRSKAGDRVDIEYVREGRYQSTSVELGEQKDWVGAFAFADGELEFDDEQIHERVEHIVERMGDGRLHLRGSRPRLGVSLVGVTDELRRHLGGRDDEGVLVGKVIEDSAAERAGIEVGDLIVAVDGESVSDQHRLRRLLRDRVGERFSVELVRDGRPTAAQVTLEEED